MNVIVFGATGSVGRLAVETMLEAGHEVTAFARRPETLALRHANLRLLAGDAADRDAVVAAMAGQDAAVVTLGAGMDRKSRIRSVGTLNVIAAMQQRGVPRLIVQSTLGAHDSWGNLNFFWKRVMFGALLRPVFRDHELQEQLVRASGLDWTIVRPSALSDQTPEGALIEDVPATRRGLGLTISREEVAGFLTRQLGDMHYLGRAVGLSH
ncbi:NAD(P)-dependent oxidoreductase [Devosia sp.]|uniref:NAD(P)-dependent oxidoreductase n=1 Tax=Devosia sp. TaxID=1871048 RepID=UPI003A913D1B